MPANARRTVVIGIGNPGRGDDAAGREVARRLRGRLPAHVELAELDGEATSLLGLLDGADSAVLIDACVSNGPPGTVRVYDVSANPLPQVGFNLSTHGQGLAEAIELARALGQLPSSCIVYAIEAASVGQEQKLSSAVAAAVDRVGERVCAEMVKAEGNRHA